MPIPAEVLHRPMFKASPILAAYGDPFYGRTTIGSGVAAVVVSTSAVNSDSVIVATAQSNTRQNSGVSNVIEVQSIVSATSFAFAWADGQSVDVRDTTIMWHLLSQAG